ncbi:threonine/serine exporter family protein [Nocardioides sp. CER19]|uniref:threonine/serine ThrE exporter family protein n=1 Tax=Nocardioides sp. CER19 TaxID=3038538 RepID=UPI002449BC7B|nr:threonine/serine exporter family protein [Nocardioides sp. CER19]MDH2414759.1 threonine/serine exporter family protein [Nocardioides sp. CER19]
MDAREVNLTFDFCLKVGELLLSSGAGAADVTATMRALARHLGLRSADVDITFTNLEMAYQESPDMVPVFATRQVKQRAIDYEDLTRVDHLVRAVLRDDVDLKDARSELARIISTGHGRHRWAVTAGLAVMAAGVAVQLGGAGPVVVLAALAATVIDRLQLVMGRRRVPVFYQQIAGAGVASLLAVCVAVPFDLEVSTAITANIIVLLAGLGFMGALQDALTGFYITAGARITEVILSTAGIIAGVSGGISVARACGLHLPEIVPAAVDLSSVSRALFGAAVGAAAFAYVSYGPLRSLLPIAVIAALAEGVTLGFPDEFAGTWAVAAAAFFVGLVSYWVSGRLRVPPLVIVVPAVVPLLPGLSIYRGLTLLTGRGDEGTSPGLLAMFTAASIAVALASGVILGEYVAQPLHRGTRRLESRLAGPRLVGPINPTIGRRSRRQRARREARRAAESAMVD